MRRFIKITLVAVFLIALLCLYLFGPTRRPFPGPLEGPVEVWFRDQTSFGNDLESRVLDDKSELYGDLGNWIVQPCTCWPDYTSYAPNLMVRGDKLYLNIRRDSMTVSVRQSIDEYWTPYTCELDDRGREIRQRLIEFLEAEEATKLKEDAL